MRKKIKLSMNENKFSSKENKRFKNKKIQSALSLALSLSMLTPCVSVINTFAIENTPAVLSESETSWQGIKLPNAVYGIAKQLDEEVTNDEIKNAYMDAVLKLNPKLSKDSIKVNLGPEVNSINDIYVSKDGIKRKTGYTRVTATYEYNGENSSFVNGDILFYALPFWEATGNPLQINKANGVHNVKKIRVADPNNYSLSEDQKNAIKKAFIDINNKNGIAKDKFSFSEEDIAVDNDGNITVKYGNNKEFKISSILTVSVFPKIDEVIMFSKKVENGNGYTTDQYSKTYNLKNNATLSEFKVLQKDINTDSDASNKENGYIDYSGKMFGMKVKAEGNSITISGVMNFNKAADSFNKHVKVSVQGSNHLYRDVSGRVAFRTVDVKNPETIYRDIDEEDAASVDKKETSLEKLKEKLKEKVTVGTVRQDSSFDVNESDRANQIKEALISEISSEEFEKIKHDTKDFYTAKGKLKTDQSTSGDISLKVRYYTKKFKIPVKDINNLTQEDKTLLQKVAAAVHGITDLTKVSVTDAGNVKITFNDGAADKEIDLGEDHLFVPKYDDKIVYPGGKESTLVKVDGKDYTFPQNTTFALPNDAPKGITVDENGKVTYNVPKDFDFGDDDSKEVTGKVLVTLDGHTDPIEVFYKFTVIEKIQPPTINKIIEGDKIVTGNGEPGYEITLKDENGNIIGKTKVKDDGIWQVVVPDNIFLKRGDVVEAEQKLGKKKPLKTSTIVEGPNEEYPIVNFKEHDYTPTYKVKAVMPNDMTVNKAEEVKANVKENIYIEKHYMNGISSEKFAPEKSLTRAEAAQILSNALKSDGYEKTADVKYNDLKANAWYMEAIKRVTAAGVFEGYEDGSFKPDKKITRAEWISTLVRFQKLEKAEGNSLNLEKHWALGDVEAALKAGWLDIYSKGIAKPLLDGEMPRCEVAAVTNKAFNKLVDKKYLKDNVEKLVHFADVKEDSPYYEEILAAANDLYRESEEIKDKNYIGHELNGPVNIELANKNVKQIKFQREAR